LVYTKNCCIFAGCKNLKRKDKIMALEINRAPILTGKAAKEFWYKVETFTTQESKTEIEEGLRKYRNFMSKQKSIVYA
jgi:hypothetical protein